MCECGCELNAERYSFAGPGKSFYVLTLRGECLNCDAPPGISIEVIEPGHCLFDEYRRGEFTDGLLKFEKWPDNMGVAIVTGMRRHEFVKAMASHLVGLAVEDFSERGKIDRISAETILEEMYEDSQTKPTLVEPSVSR